MIIGICLVGVDKWIFEDKKVKKAVERDAEKI